MKKMYIIMLFVVLVSTNVFAWDDTVTHPHMTEEAIKKSFLRSCAGSGDNGCEYLQKNLNLSNGIQTQLTGPTGGDGSGIGAGLRVTGTDGAILGGAAQKEKTAFEWLKYGSKLEDRPLCRAANHFHNPLKDWYESGLTDLSLIIQKGWCPLTSPYSSDNIKSAISWATGFNATEKETI